MKIMDTTIRNLDESVYRAMRLRAKSSGLTVGEAVTAAMRAYLSRPDPVKSGSLRDLVPEPWPAGSEHSSEDVDAVVYGT